MSPRRNHPRRGGVARRGDGVPELDEERARRGIEAVQTSSDGAWMVRGVPGDAAAKTYRCPGCDQEIHAGVPHLVVWPADGRGDLSDRRHWHNGCWRARDRRAPTVRRLRPH